MTISISYHLERENYVIRKKLNLSRLKSFLSKIFNIHTQRIAEVGAALDALYLSAQGSLKVVESYEAQVANEELQRVKSALREYRGFYDLLEKCNYFKSDELKQKAYNSLSILYDIEIELKKRAYTAHPNKRAKKSLIKTLVNHSRAGMQKSISKLG
jgi:hypothetical protein